MREGGLVVIGAREHDVTTRNGSKMAPGRYVCLFVQDEGQGMDAATLARASEPFFTTKEVGKGTGLGLSMVQGFAEQSGGRLVLTSQERVGTTAEIWLPVAAADAVSADGGDEDARHSPARDRRPLAVLAVDDDALVLMNTAALLEDMGHKVFEATSAIEALAILHDEAHIDLVISDHAMPQMTGVQLAAAIKAKWPDMPVILATGYAELPEETPSDLPRLAKPYTGKQLEDAIADAAGAVHVGGQVLELFPAHAW
jgi:CheY-like chemotaxis protein